MKDLHETNIGLIKFKGIIKKFRGDNIKKKRHLRGDTTYKEKRHLA